MIEIEELTKSYKGHIIFDKLNLRIPEGKNDRNLWDKWCGKVNTFEYYWFN
ncbi:hypothetical protein QUE96_11975 [Lactococcus lactis]|nr:hypothetical protein [Lactococcus lactis]MDM7657333.1 hypothetical protein [Lactococcus lactis]